jgi:hypothetical protein
MIDRIDHAVVTVVAEPAQVENDRCGIERRGGVADDRPHEASVSVAEGTLAKVALEGHDEKPFVPMAAGERGQGEAVPDRRAFGGIDGGEVERQRRAPVMRFAPFSGAGRYRQRRRGVSLALLTVSTAISARWAGPGQGWERPSV